MIFAVENPDGNRAYQKDPSNGFVALDRNQFSEDALSLLDRYQIKSATDPMAVLIGSIDRMTFNQREMISRFEAAIALAGIEFGRIDLAIQKAEEIQNRVESLVAALGRTQKDFALRTDKLRGRSNGDILLNHLNPLIYGIFGSVLTLLVLFVVFRMNIGR